MDKNEQVNLPANANSNQAAEAGDETLLDPVAYRDLSERLPNESLREELANMTPEQEEEFLRHLGDLAKTYLGPGGP